MRRKQKHPFHSKSLKGSYKQNRYRTDSESPEQDAPPADYKKLRVVRKNLVNASGIPEGLADDELLIRNGYFGRYGGIEKLVIVKNTPSASSKHSKNSYSAYITYESELEASLAIIALDDIKLHDKTLKIAYGTTKYCTHFTKNQDCPNILECCYLHEWDPKNEIIVSQENTKQLYAEQMKLALETVKESLEQLLKKRRDNTAKTQFPSYDDALYQLVKRGHMTAQQFDQVRKSVKKNMQPKQPASETKIKRSNSQSTIATPIKSVDLIPQNVVNVAKLLKRHICKSLLGKGKGSESKFEFARKVGAGQTGSEQLGDSIRRYVQDFVLMNKY